MRPNNERFTKWNAHIPGDFYALTFYPDGMTNEREARAYVRERLGMRRLPNGTSLWPA